LRLGDAPDFSDGEVHFIWHFMQGSIMNPATRWKLRRHWGMCDRHGFEFVAVEAAFRHGYLHGQAVLYEDLMKRAVDAFDGWQPLQAAILAFKLREAAPCLMCDLGYGPHSATIAPGERVERGKDLSEIHALAQATQQHWRGLVCGRCAGDGTPLRCRLHLREDLLDHGVNMADQQALVVYIADHITRYALSFVWGHHGTDTAEDRAALVGAIGWCSGWRPWLMLVDGPTS